MLAIVPSACNFGLDVKKVFVEVDVFQSGFPSFKIVGLPHKSIEEAKERVYSALKNLKYTLPETKVIINLAPADFPKRGSMFDVAIAIGILICKKEITDEILRDAVFLGELSLDGRIKKIRGILPMLLQCRADGVKTCYIPHENVQEGMYVRDIKIIPVESLQALIGHAKALHEASALRVKTRQKHTFSTERNIIQPLQSKQIKIQISHNEHDPLKHIHGQHYAKRAIMIAAAGFHNIYLYGPPGTGKTLLAKSLVELSPALTQSEQFEIMKIRSIDPQFYGNIDDVKRPFITPHHTISQLGLIGGGNPIVMGDVTRAHHGILFLDEAPEFTKKTLETLRQPLEEGRVVITRAIGTAVFPSKFQLVIAANPCPCGYFGHPTKQCACSNSHILSYRKKLSGPLLDRIDLKVAVEDVSVDEIHDTDETHDSNPQDVSHTIFQAHEIQMNRFEKNASENVYNSHMNHSDLLHYCILSKPAQRTLDEGYRRLQLSMRAYHKALKVSRTIADLDQAETITETHIAEALQYVR